MHRLIVVILAAVDAAIAAAVGLAAILAPLILLWVLVFAGAADWGALWPTTATIWQFGHAVPLSIELPGEYLAVAGIDPTAAAFTLSLAPLAFATLTVVSAARSGRRASQAGAWITGVLTGTLLFGAVSVALALTGTAPLAAVETWQAIVFPLALYTVPALLGAIATEWIEAGDGVVARVRDAIESSSGGWGAVAGHIARGAAVVVVGLIALGALAVTVAVWAGGGEIIALFEASHVDALGATLVTLGQFAYLPTLIVWAISFLAGPGFAIGADTTVGAAGTQVGVLPGIPVLGAIPQVSSPWLLLLALLPVALGAFAGWIVRSRLAAASPGADPVAPRLVIALGIAVVPAAVVALFAFLASGSLGPGSLAQVGPDPGPVALAVGLQVLVGAGILLLSPRRVDVDDEHLPAFGSRTSRFYDHGETDAADPAPAEAEAETDVREADPWPAAGTGAWASASGEPASEQDPPADPPPSDDETQPIEPLDVAPGSDDETQPIEPLDLRGESGRGPSVD